jgi:RimJ/RimL family protein N-acetyltransferase
MTTANVLHGERVRLAAVDLDQDLPAIAAWSRDSEFLRLLQTNVARPWTVPELRKWVEDDLGVDKPKDNVYLFVARRLADDRLLGTLDLMIPEWAHRDAWIGIGLGDRATWDQGYGSEAMRLLLRFAFVELNLHRVTLSVFGYNPRAIRAYEKLGFVHEGAQRERLRRGDQRYNLLFMGLLRREWQAGVGAPRL